MKEVKLLGAFGVAVVEVGDPVGEVVGELLYVDDGPSSKNS